MTGERRAPGTRCKLRVAWGEVPPEGDILRTRAGSCYLVERVSGKTLHCVRLGKDAVQLGEPGVWDWQWGSRNRRG